MAVTTKKKLSRVNSTIILSHNPVIKLLIPICQSDTWIPKFSRALLITVKLLNKPNCPLMHEWIKTMWYIHIYIYIPLLWWRKSYHLCQYCWAYRTFCEETNTGTGGESCTITLVCGIKWRWTHRSRNREVVTSFKLGFGMMPREDTFTK